MFGLSVQELMVLGVVAVILFGKRLPDVAKSLGTSYREFRKGLTELQSQIDIGDTFHRAGSYLPRTKSPASLPRYGVDDAEDYDQPTAPKFELPAEKATSESPTNSVS
jgi:sec-independent protein translocase protein TatA